MYWLMAVLVTALLAALLVRGRGLLGAQGRQGIRMAVRNLLLHKLRSFLSVLGIIIGTAAVVVLTALGEGSMRDALEDIKRQGATNLIVRSVRPAEEAGRGQRDAHIFRYGLTEEDRQRFEETLRPGVIATLPLRAFAGEVRPLASGRVSNGRVVATQARYADLYRLDRHLAAGRFLAEQDEAQVANVAVLGSDVAEELFPGEDALGQTVLIRGRAFEVVGVLKDRSPRSGGGDIEKLNGDVYIPLRSWRERVGQLVVTMRSADSFSAEEVPLSQVILTVRDTEQVRLTAALVRAQVGQFHPAGDVEVQVPLDRLEEAERTRDRYRVLLSLIAGISLLVGGIGIMNIMLATVTERTREIGIRRAVGARRIDITVQFLLETLVQTTLGAVAGVAAGLALMYAIPLAYLLWQHSVLQVPPSQVHTVPVQVHVPSILLAFFMALGVGALFGWYPARRASLLDPIEALRHD